MASTDGLVRPRRLLSAVRLVLAVQRRSGFLHIYGGMTVVTILIIHLAIPESWRLWVVPGVLLGEYGTTGVFMTAAHRYLERIEGSNVALVVTPLEPREHVLAMILGPALVATVSGTILFVAVLGLDGRAFSLIVPLWLTAMIAGAVGIVLSSRHDEFTRFLVGSIPVVTVFSLPFLSFFGFTPRWTFAWLPWDAALFSFANLARPEPVAAVFVVLLIELTAFTALGLVWAERSHAAQLSTVGAP